MRCLLVCLGESLTPAFLVTFFSFFFRHDSRCRHRFERQVAQLFKVHKLPLPHDVSDVDPVNVHTINSGLPALVNEKLRTTPVAR